MVLKEQGTKQVLALIKAVEESVPTKLSDLQSDASNRTVSDAQIESWDSSVKDISVTQKQTSGVEIGSINVDGIETKLFAPEGGSNKNVWLATCSTNASTSAKVVTTIDEGFELVEGTVIYVRFGHANTVTGTITLNVNNTGAKSVFARQPQSSGPILDVSNRWEAGEFVQFAYYNGVWYIVAPTSSSNGGGISTLWTNSSPGSNFTAQTISLDLSAYKMLKIEFRMNTSSTGYFTFDVPVNGHQQGCTSVNPANNATTYTYTRQATASATGVEFQGGRRKQTSATSSASVDNQYMIPTTIWGIK